mgnify:CR=1 FL=1
MKNDIKILNDKEINNLLGDFPGWEYKDNKISKEFSFEDFMDCLTFIVKLSPIFEMNDHHPDIHLFYSKILFELQRFDVGGKVTNRDFEAAREIEEKYKEWKD